MDRRFIFVMAVAAVLMVVYCMLADRLKARRGVDSDEKRDIEELIREKIPGIGAFTPLFAWNEDGEGNERCFHYYAVAFQTASCWLIPISYQVRYTHSELTGGEPVCYSIENLDRVRFVPEKNQVTAAFYCAGDKEPVTFTVSASNTKFSKICPVDISQKEELEQFLEFLGSFSKEVEKTDKNRFSGKR